MKSAALLLVFSLLAQHPGKSGIYVLEKGEESLLARAYLSNQAQQSIDIQYYIWTADNVGILATEALVRAAERGVRVRVLVDDSMMEVEAEHLLSIDDHPLIDIRIYNPNLSVGVSRWTKYKNILLDFRGINQRMHDKTFIVDGIVGITGGRNVADEYYDFDQKYNFRDRDALLMGPVVEQMQANFNRFWESPLSVSVDKILSVQKKTLNQSHVDTVISDLHRYAQNPENYSDEVRDALAHLPQKFKTLTKQMIWDDVLFISDSAGKDIQESNTITNQLKTLVQNAKFEVIIQSPYLVFSKEGLTLFGDLVKRGVSVKINTNSLPATDNLYAFSGYSKRRRQIVKKGIQVYEFKPDAAVRKELLERYREYPGTSPVFAIHAKTLVVDRETVYIGTFNLDPRSANLNTEVGVLVTNKRLAEEVSKAIETDMAPANSWHANTENSDRFAPWKKRMKVFLFSLLPLQSLL